MQDLAYKLSSSFDVLDDLKNDGLIFTFSRPLLLKDINTQLRFLLIL